MAAAAVAVAAEARGTLCGHSRQGSAGSITARFFSIPSDRPLSWPPCADAGSSSGGGGG